MEAISTGSSTAFKSAAPGSAQYYEPVTPIPEGERYSYARMSRSDLHHQAQDAGKDQRSFYDDPDNTPIVIQAEPIAKHAPISHLEHPGQAKARRARSKSPSKLSVPAAESVGSDNQGTVFLANPHHTVMTNKDQYDLVDATASTEPVHAEYVNVNQLNIMPSQIKKSVTVPKGLSTLAELSIEDPPSMDPGEAQLWLLNQMQKLVEKFAGIYESTSVGPLPENIHGKAQLREIEEIYDEVQDEPSAPPIPPRTYSCSIQAASESAVSGKASKTFRHSKSIPSASPTDIKLERSPQRPPVRPKPDSQGMLNCNSTIMTKRHEGGLYCGVQDLSLLLLHACSSWKGKSFTTAFSS